MKVDSTFTHRNALPSIVKDLQQICFLFLFKQYLRVNGPGVVKITRFILNPPLWWSLNGLQTMEGDVVEIFVFNNSKINAAKLLVFTQTFTCCTLEPLNPIGQCDASKMVEITNYISKFVSWC